MDSGGWGSREDLGGVGGGNIIRIEKNRFSVLKSMGLNPSMGRKGIGIIKKKN